MTVISGGEVLVPKGDTLIQAGNRVVAVTVLDSEPVVRDSLCGVGS